MTHFTASTRLDLPQPFGPTTPVSPRSIRKSVGSTKDLKPSKRSRVNFMSQNFCVRAFSEIGIARSCARPKRIGLVEEFISRFEPVPA